MSCSERDVFGAHWSRDESLCVQAAEMAAGASSLMSGSEAISSWEARAGTRGRPRGFTLLELLVCAAIISLLAAILLPILRTARIKAKVARAHADLRNIGTAIESYRLDQEGYPLARAFCAGGGMKVDDYNECPQELLSCGYLGTFPEDVFNEGRAYKYIAPGLGYSNRVLTILAIWVPEKFPGDDGHDIPYLSSKDSPVKWAVWSVGPSGPKEFWESEALHYPVPRRNWYNFKNGPESEGVIVHLSTGDSSP